MNIVIIIAAVLVSLGAKVETQAYAPLMHRLAAQGIDCFAADAVCRFTDAQ